VPGLQELRDVGFPLDLSALVSGPEGGVVDLDVTQGHVRRLAVFTASLFDYTWGVSPICLWKEKPKPAILPMFSAR
jgi:hypothetical protein